jgi:hypothetical protein
MLETPGYPHIIKHGFTNLTQNKSLGIADMNGSVYVSLESPFTVFAAARKQEFKLLMDMAEQGCLRSSGNRRDREDA